MDQQIIDFIFNGLERFGFPMLFAGYLMWERSRTLTTIANTLKDIGEVNAAVLVYLSKNGIHCKNRKVDEEEVAEIRKNPFIMRFLD